MRPGSRDKRCRGCAVSHGYSGGAPPELIGTGKAVSKERPEVISRTVELVSRISKGVHVITGGAGIESGSDVSAALSLGGTQGVLVASAIVKARNWRDKITELALPLLGGKR